MDSIARKSRTISDFKVPTVEEIKNARKKRPVAIMLTVYADESSDEKQNRIFAIGGLIGSQEEWDSVERTWLDRTGGIEFHATDCEANRGNFRDSPPEKNRALYKDLTNILAQSPLWGFGNAIDIRGYKDTVPHTLDVAPYFQCFLNVVDRISQLGSVYIPRQKVKFIFHRRFETQYNAFYLYDFLCKSDRVGPPKNMMDEISSATSATIGIQVADLFSREVMKDFEWHLDRQAGVIIRRRRLSWETLNDTNRFKYMFWFKEDFEHLVQRMSLMKKEKGDQWAAYEKWLLQEGCADNAENRTRFLFYTESIETKSNKSKVKS